MCTEMLTSTGWKNDMTAVGFLLQLKTILEGNGKIDLFNKHEYTEEEALSAFVRVSRENSINACVFTIVTKS